MKLVQIIVPMDLIMTQVIDTLALIWLHPFKTVRFYNFHIDVNVTSFRRHVPAGNIHFSAEN